MPQRYRDLPPEAKKAILKYRLSQAQSAMAATLITTGLLLIVGVQIVDPSRAVGMKFFVGGLACVGAGVLVGSLARAHRDRR